jgi:hypothetical protein
MLLWSDQSRPACNSARQAGIATPPDAIRKHDLSGRTELRGDWVTRPSEKPNPAEFDLLPLQRRIDKPWGWELIWADNEFYTGKFLHVYAGKRLSLQYHDSKTETQCLLSGRAVLMVEAADGSMAELAMEIGKGYTLQPYQAHRLIALDDIDIVEVSTAEMGTTIRLEDDFLRGDETEEIRSLPHRGWNPDDATATL